MEPGAPAAAEPHALVLLSETRERIPGRGIKRPDRIVVHCTPPATGSGQTDERASLRTSALPGMPGVRECHMNKLRRFASVGGGPAGVGPPRLVVLPTKVRRVGSLQ